MLEHPSLIWLPAGILTVFAVIVYILTIKSQISQAYLWPDKDWRRTICTSAAYIALCTIMASVVLCSIRDSAALTLSNIWSSFLVAVLSLTGIGWKGPASWVESIGIKSPNYADGRISARRMVEIALKARGKPFGEKRDVADFLKAIDDLRANIEKNIELEPTWAKEKLEEVCRSLRTTAEQTKELFPLSDTGAVMDFAGVFNAEKHSQYEAFIDSLKTLSKYWRELKLQN